MGLALVGVATVFIYRAPNFLRFAETNQKLGGKLRKIPALTLLTALVATALTPTAALALGAGTVIDLETGLVYVDADICRSGNGTQSDPWLVTSAYDLSIVGSCGVLNSNGWVPFESQDQYYKLVNDIHLTQDWIPLDLQAAGGNYLAQFDGNGKKISGLVIPLGDDPSDLDNRGLFGNTKNATIKNLSLETGNLIRGQYDIGALVGKAVTTTIENVHVKIPADGAVWGIQGVGGLVGEARESSVVKSSSVIGLGDANHIASVFGATNIGGLIGNLDDSTAKNLASLNLTIQASSSYSLQGNYTSGGIIGRYLPYADAEVSGFISNASVVATKVEALQPGTPFAGGLIGRVRNADGSNQHWIKINNSAFRGYVLSINPGAFVGVFDYVSSAEFANDYSTGSFSTDDATTMAGEFVGDYASTPTTFVKNIFESSSGSGLKLVSYPNSASSVGSITDLASVPASWSIIRATANQKVSETYSWVLNSSSSFNDRRPMPVALYNLGVFGAVVEPTPAPAPSSSNSGSSGGGFGSSSDSGIQPVASQPKKTSSSFFRIGNKLRVNCTSGQSMRIFINGHTLARAEANSVIRKTFTLRRGVNLVKFVTGREVARALSFNVR